MFIYLVLSFTIHVQYTQPVSTSEIFQRHKHQNLLSANDEFLRAQAEDAFNVIVDNKYKKERRSNGLESANKNFLNSAKQNNMTENKPKPATHVAFLKVHKTASSTAQNVFLKFGDENNLTFVLAHTKGESGWLNVISYNNSLTETNIVPPPTGKHFDLLCCHVIYDRKSFETVLPPDTEYIGIVREPISRFQSAVKYFSPHFILKLPGKSPLSIYAKNPLAFEPENPRNSQTNNRMAVEFGFPTELFPGKKLNGSQTEIDNYISKLDKEFKFIIISEKFDDSMVIMKRLLNWHTRNVLYLDKNVGSKITNTRKILPPEDKDKIRKFLYLDTAIYKLAMKRFNQYVEDAGKDFKDEVADFKSMREKVKTFCQVSKAVSMLIQATQWYDEFTVTKNDCKMFTKHEKDLIQKQRFRMYGVLEN
ncbi:galactose-3-O-sulfotransferase 2-like isoform X2 [Mercenaria mercenaria]|nr:galactose-3-O-sulfotransferase 2-like isoform X2 [Mercenaria mercenaria]XP_045209674.2 galactose-3-O-sulfotransferase 2-like isoform X2 [Mercenaria mercenaria]